MLDEIISLEQIQEFIKEVRNYKDGFITNFFLDRFKHNLWIEKKTFYFQQINKTVFLIHKTPLFNSVFFISTNKEELIKALPALDVLDTVVFDLVGNQTVSDLKDLFILYGYHCYQSLHRMNRCGPFEIQEPSSDVMFATKEYRLDLLALLETYFDPLAEQLPMLEELDKWINEETVLIIKKDNKIVGFLIYELIGVTLYLRYWFVHPEFREQRIGSKLFCQFMYIGKNTKRQLFWVINDNENAIKRYEHYGFVSEKMFDYVLLKK